MRKYTVNEPPDAINRRNNSQNFPIIENYNVEISTLKIIKM
jgi:hypothetical protein